MNRLSVGQMLALFLAFLMAIGPVPAVAQQPPQPQQSSTAMLTTPVQRVDEFEIIAPRPEEKEELTDQQMELLIAQLVSPIVRNSVLNGRYEDFRTQYRAAKNRTDEEKVLLAFNRDAQALRNVPIALSRPEDVEIITPPPEYDKRRWVDIREWGVVEQHRMGPPIDCEKDPFGFATARGLIIKAMVDRSNGIPGFDTAHKAAFLRAFDDCMKVGPDGHCKIELAREHPYLDWAIGGRGPAFDLHYSPDPRNTKAMEAKTLVVFVEEFGEWYDVGCACGGNFGKKSGIRHKTMFRVETAAPLCKEITGTLTKFTSDNQRGDYDAVLDKDNLEVRNDRWSLGTKDVSSSGTTHTALVGSELLSLPGHNLLTYLAEAREKGNAGSNWYQVTCSIDLTKELPSPLSPPSPTPVKRSQHPSCELVCTGTVLRNADDTYSCRISEMNPDGEPYVSKTVGIFNGSNAPTGISFPQGIGDFSGKRLDFGRFHGTLNLRHFGLDSSGKELFSCPATISTQEPPPETHKFSCGPIYLYCWGPPVAAGVIYGSTRGGAAHKGACAAATSGAGPNAVPPSGVISAPPCH